MAIRLCVCYQVVTSRLRKLKQYTEVEGMSESVLQSPFFSEKAHSILGDITTIGAFVILKPLIS
jgi:hypothetical protein